MCLKKIVSKIKSNKAEALFFLLVFLVFFRFDAIPFQTDEWGYIISAKYLTSEPFSQQTFKTLNEYQLLSRPMGLVLFVPFFLVFGTDYLLAMPLFHLLLSLLTLFLIYFNFKLFDRLFGRSTAFLSSFLLAASFFVVYTLWYTASVNINIAALCLVATLYFTTRIKESSSKFFIAFFMTVGMLTRETIAIPFLLMALVFVATSKEARFRISNLVALFGPFALFAAVLFLLTGFVVQPLHVGMISASNNFVANLDVYFNYWFGYYLLIPIIVLSIVIFFAALLFSAKKFFSSKKKINISFFPISPKQSIILVLIAAFIGGLVPLALSNESSPRYVVPVLPIIFGFVSAFFCVAVLGRLDDKAKKFFIAFLLFNLVFWVLFFNAGLLVSFLGIGMVDTVAIAYNILFFAGIFSVLAFAVFCFFKNKNFNMRVLPTLLAFAVMLWLVAFSSIVQLNELNVFYVTHYHNSTIAFQANKFLAENLPEKATVYTQQDLSWIYFLSLEAFGRKDVNLFLYAPAVSELKKGDYLVYNSRVGSGIWAVLSSDKNKFELLASFGGGFKKYLRSKLEKAELLKTGLLFSFFKDSSETMDVYVFNG